MTEQEELHTLKTIQDLNSAGLLYMYIGSLVSSDLEGLEEKKNALDILKRFDECIEKTNFDKTTIDHLKELIENSIEILKREIKELEK